MRDQMKVIISAVGPTGCGKSVAIHTMLRALQERKCFTIEGMSQNDTFNRQTKELREELTLEVQFNVIKLCD